MRTLPATGRPPVRFKRMPRFFFHLHNDIDVPDSEGKDFDDFAAAMAYARMVTLQEVSEHVRERGRIVLSHRIDVEDERHTVVATVRFSDVLHVEP